MPEELRKLELEVDPWFSLSELRVGADGRKALISHGRQKRPDAIKVETQHCAFCPENRGNLKRPFFLNELVEEMEGRGLYVLENKFPSFSPPEVYDKLRKLPPLQVYMVNREIAIGRHLVMIETSNHHLDPFVESDTSQQYYDNLVWGFIQTLRTLRAEGHAWGGLGKNRNGINKDGSIAYAGASQEHLHSQFVGTTIVTPKWLEEKIVRCQIEPRNASDIFFQTYQGKKSLLSCVQCIEVLEYQPNERVKIADDGSHFSFVAPIGDQPPYHYEISIVPYNHHGLFEEMSHRDTFSFARVLSQTMRWLYHNFGNCGYNYELRQGPWKINTYGLAEHYNQLFHWKFNIYPATSEIRRSAKTEGFLSHLLGIPILPEAPENIALRTKGK